MSPRDGLGWLLFVCGLLIVYGVDVEIDGRHYTLHPTKEERGCR